MAWGDRAERRVLSNREDSRGRRMSRMAPGAKRTPEGPGGRRVTRRALSSLDCAHQSGAGIVEWAGRAAACVMRCWIRRVAAAWKVMCLVDIL